MIELAHWYDTVISLGFVYLFFAHNTLLAFVAVVAAYFLVILIDNTFARVRWQLALESSWFVAIVFGVGNIVVLFLMKI